MIFNQSAHMVSLGYFLKIDKNTVHFFFFLNVNKVNGKLYQLYTLYPNFK